LASAITTEIDHTVILRCAEVARRKHLFINA